MSSWIKANSVHFQKKHLVLGFQKGAPEGQLAAVQVHRHVSPPVVPSASVARQLVEVHIVAARFLWVAAVPKLSKWLWQLPSVPPCPASPCPSLAKDSDISNNVGQTTLHSGPRDSLCWGWTELFVCLAHGVLRGVSFYTPSLRWKYIALSAERSADWDPTGQSMKVCLKRPPQKGNAIREITDPAIKLSNFVLRLGQPVSWPRCRQLEGAGAPCVRVAALWLVHPLSLCGSGGRMPSGPPETAFKYYHLGHYFKKDVRKSQTSRPFEMRARPDAALSCLAFDWTGPAKKPLWMAKWVTCVAGASPKHVC